jgi:hypothetical protein
LRGARLQGGSWAPNTTWTQYALIEEPIGYLQLNLNASPFAGGDDTHYPTFATNLAGGTTDGAGSWICLGRSSSAINPSNAALIVNDFIQDPDHGLAADPATIDASSVIAAANVCEEQVLIIWNGDNTKVYENLYNCDGIFDHSTPRGNVLQALCDAMAGYAVPPGDLWHSGAGAYVAPSVSLGDGDMRAAIKGDVRLSRRDAANSIKGTYAPRFLPSNAAAAVSLTQIPPTWQRASYPSYQSSAYITEDGGQVLWKDVNFEFCTSLWQAQRLAKIALMRLRFQETLHLPAKLAALQLEAGDTFSFVHLRWNFNGTVFEVVQSAIVIDQSGNAQGGSGGNQPTPAIGIDLVARRTDPAVYEFTAPSSPSNFGDYQPYGITGVMDGPR